MDDLDKKILEAIKNNPEFLKQLGITTEEPKVEDTPVKKKRGRPKGKTKQVEKTIELENVSEVEIPVKKTAVEEDAGDREARREPIKKGKAINNFKDSKTFCPEDIEFDKKALKNIVDTGSSRPKHKKVEVTCRRCNKTYAVEPHVLPSFSYGQSSYVCSRCIGV